MTRMSQGDQFAQSNGAPRSCPIAPSGGASVASTARPHLSTTSELRLKGRVPQDRQATRMSDR